MKRNTFLRCMHKCVVTTLILLFGCDQQQPKDENSGESFSESSKADTIHSMPDHVDSFSEDGIQIGESDTVIISGHRIIFQLTDSVEMPDIFDDSPLRKQMTDSIGNSHQRYILIEKYLAKKFSSYFTADDNTLIVFLENKSQMKFPKWDVEKDEGYNFEHHFASIGYCLLRVQWGEGNDWMLVNSKNGFKKRIIGEPYISPDAKSILSVNSTMPGYGYNGIELLSISGDTLKTEFRLDIINWGATRAKWLSNRKVVIETESGDDIDSKKSYRVLTID